MASKSEYEMLFRLNAQMNGGFSGTFSKAQTEFTRLGKEVQSLHRVQSDIASFQKQQSAIEATRSKLENLQKQHDLLQREIGETQGSTAGLEREDAKLEQRIQDTQAALERQQQRLDTTGARLQAAGVSTDNLSEKDRELTARIRELEAEQDKAAESAVSFGDKAAQAFDAVGNIIATAGIAAGLREIGETIMECVGVAGDFEEAMSTVAALSQANAEDMASLTAEAKELGATTKFTAKESADAMGYMAMAGWDASEMLAGMDSVMRLAAASGEDLAQVSDIVTDNLTAFGLKASDTARFADVLAAAATKSNTSVSIMGETFKSSASVAGALGYSIEDVAVATGLMANAGVKGSRAGTALRNVFNGLLEGVTLTGAAFGEYEYSAVQADGTMRGFADTIDDLRVYFDQMTEAERVNNAMTIAGERGYNGLLAILNATDEDYQSLTASINQSAGAAQRMAAIKLDNLNGDLTIMNSAWDALKMTIGEQFTPELRKTYTVLTDVFGSINQFVKNHPATMKAATAFVGVIGTATAALTGYAAVSKVVKALDLASSFSIVGPIMLGVGAVATLTAGIVGLTSALKDNLPSLEELTEEARGLEDAIAEAEGNFKGMATSVEATADVAEKYIDKLDDLDEGTQASNEHSQTYLNTLHLLCDAVPELAEYIDLETGAINGGTQALREHIDAWKQDAQEKAYREYMNQVYEKYNGVMQKSAETSILLTEAETEKENADKRLSNIADRKNEIYGKAVSIAEQLNKENQYSLTTAEEIIGTMGEESDEYNRLIDEEAKLTVARDEAADKAEIYSQALEDDSAALAEAEGAIDSAKDALKRLTGSVDDGSDAMDDAVDEQEALRAAIAETYAQVDALAEAYAGAYNAAYESVSGQYAIWDEAAKEIPVKVEEINKSMTDQIEYWQKFNFNLEKLSERTGDIEGLSEVIASFADGSADSVNAIAGMADASDEDLRAMVKNWQDLKAEQKTVSDSIAEITIGYQTAVEEFQAVLESEIGDMELNAQAKSNAISTIQGYIDGANEMLPQVQKAYNNVARTAEKALYGYAGGSGSPINYSYPPGYASGTDDAEPGVKLVGENGPELMFFHGGEKVLNTAQTTALQAKSGAPLESRPVSSGRTTPVQVTFQIQGNATLETVQNLQAFTDEVVERVLAAIDEADDDDRRRGY